MLKRLNFKMTERGISIYLALMIMLILLTIALGINAIIASQIRIIRGMGYSVVALYAADTGIEMVLLERAGPTQSSYSGYLDLNNNGDGPDEGDASFAADVVQPITGTVPGIPQDPTCTADNYCIKSVGRYRETKRAIEITY